MINQKGGKKIMEKERVYEKIVINAGWIKSNTEKHGWQRNLYPSRVNHFINHIKNGTFKSSLITVAKKGKTLIVLDGQHKLEAISRAEISKEMDFCIHKGLSEEDMIELYRVLNNVKQPRLIDDIKIHLDKSEWLDSYMKEDFPINISFNGGVNSMRIDSFLNVIKNGYQNEFTRRNLSRKNINEFIEDLDQMKYLTMSDFCNFYKGCFGEPSRENWLYKNVIMFTVFRIWKANKSEFNQDEMVKAFKPVENNDSIRRETSSSYDINAMEMLTRKVYNIINKKRSVNKFVPFWEEEMLIEM